MGDFGKAKCANPDCKAEFTKKASNAIYCKPECRTKIMNQRILARYHSRKNRINSTEKRLCKSRNCTNILSRYNTEDICEPCKTERLINRLGRWGWDTDKLREDWSE